MEAEAPEGTSAFVLNASCISLLLRDRILPGFQNCGFYP
ncbi:hypothetical protein EV199_4257 [Pseudobacter ginsenosidimutans]|uniref:Uncharacterized protein n=1 Tax=Pseudobacter ginsenosidimutans TaxID=661488 RepID=A0A4Q7MUT1_9BACT|nr:hypothetical protein EV199_4257 [Pseudobacter ginsenosidimutans]